MGPPGMSSNYKNNSNLTGYITEKMYVLLQLYLQNKNWNPSLELLQCFTELKEASMLPSASYLQMLVTKISLNNQGRLILRENGKLIIPYEQFANAIMMKHLDGPRGIHLTLEATIRAVMESFTIGKESFGMEKEFIIEIVQNCPNPACYYYKTQLSQKSTSMGLIYPQESDLGSGKIRSNLSHSPDFSSTIPLTSNIGASLSDISENRNINNLHLHNHSSSPKKVSSKHYDSSLIVVPSIDSYRLVEYLRTNSENYENLINLRNLGNSGKELLSMHNGIFSVETDIKNVHSTSMWDDQEKIIRIFAELMKNMTRMKTCVKPAMCKPYGKQSETLQKTLVDTIQLIQSLRNFLPPPHIPVSSWKNEDKHGLDYTYLSVL